MFIRDILKCALKIKGYFLNIPKVWGGQGGERRRETRRKGRQEEKRGRENRKF